MNKGDIVLIPFPFTDLSGNKNKPALISRLVLIHCEYHAPCHPASWLTEKMKYQKLTPLSGKTNRARTIGMRVPLQSALQAMI